MSHTYDPLQDGKSRLTLIDFMGGDLSVVNDAKASYDNYVEEITEKEVKLINYLIDPPEGKQHTSPLRGTIFKFRVKAPLFVCRQWWKHHIASSHLDEQNQWNEKSFRYSKIKDSDDYYVPKEFHEQSSVNKQASGLPLDSAETFQLTKDYVFIVNTAYWKYDSFLKQGVVREEARALLPVCQYTTFVWTVSLQALLNFIDLREGYGAQTEIIKYAECLKQVASIECPHVFDAWERRKNREREALKLYKWCQENLMEDYLFQSANDIIGKISLMRADTYPSKEGY